jgi:hypothetical protein
MQPQSRLYLSNQGRSIFRIDHLIYEFCLENNNSINSNIEPLDKLGIFMPNPLDRMSIHDYEQSRQLPCGWACQAGGQKMASIGQIQTNTGADRRNPASDGSLSEEPAWAAGE